MSAASPGPKVTPIRDALGDPSLPSVWLGQAGPAQAEVFEIVAAEQPSVEAIRSAWHKRRGQRAVPLIAFWQGASRVVLTEPIGEAASIGVVQLEPAAALAVIQQFLNAPWSTATAAALALL